MHKGMKTARVKRDYLIRLDTERYRVDTVSRCSALHVGLQRPPSVRSSAKRDATLSLSLTCTAAPASIITSQGRGRVL